MIEFRNFSKVYNDSKNAATENISFVAKNKSITVLLGENGASKSTILKASCAIHYPTSGDVFVSDSENKLHNTREEIALIKKNVGFIQEDEHLENTRYVIEVISECAKIFSVTNLSDIKKIVTLCSLENVLDKKIKTLSKGFFNRLLIALALIPNPPNVVLDEPTNALDPVQHASIMSLLSELSKTKTILFSTHNLLDVSNLPCNIVIISNGKLLLQGSEKEIIQKTKTKTLEEAFLFLTKSKNVVKESSNE